MARDDLSEILISRDDLLVGNARRGGPPPPVLHDYGNALVIEADPRDWPEAGPGLRGNALLTENDRLGIAAFDERTTRNARGSRGAEVDEETPWDQIDGPLRLVEEAPEVTFPREGGASGGIEEAPFSLSGRLSGSVAVALVVVSGPTPDLRIDPDERVRIVAAVQEGTGFLARQSPARDVSFVHEAFAVDIAAPDSSAAEVEAGRAELRAPRTSAARRVELFEMFEAGWRDRALAAFGHRAGPAGIRDMALAVRARKRTDWAYVAFVTKYRALHYAYAIREHSKLILTFANTDLGIAGIDGVFAHETGHIFGAADEYGDCRCTTAHGHFNVANSNCRSCAPGGGSNCLMFSNTLVLCEATRYHLGFAGLPALGGGGVA